jgi:hypothetical protein
MRDSFQIYCCVKKLVLKGIISPSVVMREIVVIKNWRTAKKYVDRAVEELSAESEINNKNELTSIVEGLKTLKSDLLLNLEKKQHFNQSLGAVHQILKINEQLIKLLQLNTVTPAIEAITAINYIVPQQPNSKNS